MRLVKTLMLLVTFVSHIAAPHESRAESLASIFDQVLRFEGVLDTSPRFRRELERVLVGFKLNAVRTADIVTTATTPGFVYEYDP